jgi:hypothetical protein
MAPSLPPELPRGIPPVNVKADRSGSPHIVVFAVIALLLAVMIYLFLMAAHAPEITNGGVGHDLAEVSPRQERTEREGQGEQQDADRKSGADAAASNDGSDVDAGGRQGSEDGTRDKTEPGLEKNPPADATRSDKPQATTGKSAATHSASDDSKALRQARDLATQSEKEARRGNYGEAFERARDAWLLVRSQPQDSEYSTLTRELERELARLGDLANREVRKAAPTKPLKER